MTLQAFFNKAMRGMAAQGFRKSVRKGHCVYRGPRGARCAVGHCIPDSKYKAEFDAEGLSVYAIAEDLGWDLEVEKLAATLQVAHDGASTPSSMRKRFKVIAETHGLKLPPEIK